MSLSEYAAWWGAVVATAVLLWDVIKWRSRGPRLRTLISQPSDGRGLEFTVFISNTGDQPATIESVKLKCFERRLLFLRRELDLEHSFSLSGSNGFPPLTLQPGEPWEVSISPSRKIPALPKHDLTLAIDIQESHRTKPHRFHPNSHGFNDYLRTRKT